MPEVPWQIPCPFSSPGGACSPDELGAGEQQLLVEVVARGGDDSRRARAPLELPLAAPVREPVLTRRRARERGGGVGAQRLVARVVDLEQRPHVAGEPVDGADAAEARPPEPLRPEAVRVAAGGERVRRLAGQVVPAHGDGGDERSGRPPHEVLGLVGEVGADAVTQVVFERMAEPAGDEQDPGLAGEEPRRARLGDDLPFHVVRLGTPALERAQRGCRQVERRLGETAAPQVVERPDHAGRADVEVLQRQRSVLAVPLVRGPERVGSNAASASATIAAMPSRTRASSHGSSVSGSNAAGS